MLDLQPFLFIYSLETNRPMKNTMKEEKKALRNIFTRRCGIPITDHWCTFPLERVNNYIKSSLKKWFPNVTTLYVKMAVHLPVND